MMSINESFLLPSGCFRRLQVGERTILLANRNEEWCYSTWLGDAPDDLPDSGTADELNDNYDWIRWDNAAGDEEVKISPAFPDLALIARPHGIINIPSGGSALFHLGIPASVKISAACSGKMTSLATLPTQELSKTWHGTQHQGESCYALKTHARRKIQNLGDYTNHIICQIDVQNRSPAVSSFDRLYLETGHLAICEHEGQLWSSACRIKVKEADEKFTRIIFSNTPLSPATEATEIVPPALGKTQKASVFNPFSSFMDVLSK